MPELSIESNGRIENTAVYYNGEQLGGVRELMLNLEENGTFDAILTYTDENGQVVTRNVMSDLLEGLQTRDPSFSREEAESMRLLTIASEGDIESTIVSIDGNEQFGIVSLYLHLKAPPETTFRAEVTYREDADRLTTESIF